MYCAPSTTVSFTGHRTYAHQADKQLEDTIRLLYDTGARLFLSGMACGFDLAAADAVIRLRKSCPGLRLGCIVPFEGQERRFPPQEQHLYRMIRQLADEELIVCDGYRADCYQRRNDLLVEQASVLVAWYDGSTGGTRYTVRRAARLGRRIVNLCLIPREMELPGLF